MVPSAGTRTATRPAPVSILRRRFVGALSLMLLQGLAKPSGAWQLAGARYARYGRVWPRSAGAAEWGMALTGSR